MSINEKKIEEGLLAIEQACKDERTFTYWHNGEMWLLVGLSRSDTEVKLQLEQRAAGKSAEKIIPQSDREALYILANAIKY